MIWNWSVAVLATKAITSTHTHTHTHILLGEENIDKVCDLAKPTLIKDFKVTIIETRMKSLKKAWCSITLITSLIFKCYKYQCDFALSFQMI